MIKMNLKNVLWLIFSLIIYLLFISRAAGVSVPVKTNNEVLVNTNNVNNSDNDNDLSVCRNDIILKLKLIECNNPMYNDSTTKVRCIIANNITNDICGDKKQKHSNNIRISDYLESSHSLCNFNYYPQSNISNEINLVIENWFSNSSICSWLCYKYDISLKIFSYHEICTFIYNFYIGPEKTKNESVKIQQLEVVMNNSKKKNIIDVANVPHFNINDDNVVNSHNKQENNINQVDRNVIEEKKVSLAHDQTDEIEQESNLFIFFLILSILSITLYTVMYNRKRILALLIEGRRGISGNKRRPNSAAYRKLDCNLEEAMSSTSGLSSNTTNLLY